LYSDTIYFEDIKESLLSKNGLQYQIKAEQKIVNLKKIKKSYIIFQKQYVKDHNYYLNGTFYQKDIQIKFKKGYFLEGSFFMIQCESNFKEMSIKAPKAKYSKNNIEFQNVQIIKNKKHFRKVRYIVPLL